MIQTVLLFVSLACGISAFGTETNSVVKKPGRKIASDGNFYCTGTEPFWSLDIKNGKVVTYSDPITMKLKTRNINSSQDTAGSNQGIAYSVQSGSGNDVAVIKYVGNCSDGMSDNEYPYDVSFLTVDKKGVSLFFTGCCKEATTTAIKK